MGELSYTPAQRQAVTVRGRPVLVSAGAGSGKTRVLIQRLLERVREGEDIDRFLVITFTRAAAAELKGRILRELDRLSALNPADRRLRRQSALLYNAQIGTIDSFCTAVVRENARLLELSPTFSVLAQDRADELLRRSLEEVMDRAYETMGDDPGFQDLVACMGEGMDDSALSDAVLMLYRRLQGQAWPRAWVREQLDRMEVTGLTDVIGTPWGKYLLGAAAAEAADAVGRLEAALALMVRPGDPNYMDGYRESFSRAAEFHRGLVRACGQGWDEANRALAAGHPDLSRKRKNIDPELRDRVKPVWDDSRAVYKRLRELLDRPSETHLRELSRARPMLAALTEMVFALEEAYTARKRRADTVDFPDVEHFCLRLLSDGENGVAARLSARFAEVMVDEYQDVNDVQEQIFSYVSGGGQRLFMVGDVKQSIYRFRLAEPEIFQRKYRDFGGREDAARVDLRENFRSRGAVLDACNAVFERIMSPALGDVAYDEHARLVRGEDYYPAREREGKPVLVVLDRDAFEKTERSMLEPRYVARRIRAMVEAGEPVHDGAGGLRPVTYADIAILLRTANRTGGAYRQALEEAGVPVSAGQSGDFFSLPEIRFCVSMLAAADNPRQDVPLVAAMRGLPFAFTPDELSAVRAADRTGDLWDAVNLRAQEDEKCARFVREVNLLRDLAREAPTVDLLRRLYDRTGLFAACAALPDGLRRGTALMQLYEYARQFEAEGSRGLFRFVAWLRQMEQDEVQPGLASDSGAVQILSIHKSKGLEFPVVFLADNNHRWTDKGHSRVRLHNSLGLGMRLTDEALGVSWATLPMNAIRHRERLEEISEWERLLYVGMTRAQERLIMTCCMERAGDLLAECGGPGDGPLPPAGLARDANIARWLLRAAVADNGRAIDLQVVSTAEAAFTQAPPPPEPLPADPGDVAALRARLSWQYPHTAAAMLPSKLTATGLRPAGDEPDPEALPLPAPAGERTDAPPAGEEEPGGPRPLRLPDLGRIRALTGAERGVAAHLAMQHIDFARTGSLDEIRAEIERLRALGRLTDEQAAAVAPGDILAFFSSPLGRRVRAAERVYREFRFSLLCPAARWYPEAGPEDEILLQGVVDLCIEEADGTLTVIDFKTDKTPDPARYAPQLDAYAGAMARITGKPVAVAVLWYLRLRRAVPLPVPGA